MERQKDDIIKELQELLLRQSERFAILNKFSIELEEQTDETISLFIVNEFRQLFQVKYVWISTYDEQKSELVVTASTMSELENTKLFQKLGRSIIGFRTQINSENYNLMVKSGIGEPSSLYEISFGQIPSILSVVLEKIFGIGWFQGISLTNKDRLFGAMMIAGYKGQSVLNRDELKIFTEITSNILKRKLTERELLLKNIQLQKTNAEKDKFFSIIAHDLRSPFNNFLGFTQMMTDEINTLTLSEIQQIAEVMRKSATNLHTLLENILEWAMMQRGMMEFKPEKSVLKARIVHCIDLLKDSANKKNINIYIDVSDVYEIYADNHMFDAIIRNLVANALKFTPRGGKITVSASIKNDKSVEISVSDTGIGMDSQLLENLFKIDADTRRNGTDDEMSTGLGLVLCKEFVEKHGGKLLVKSEEGKGSTFSFTLSER